MYEVGTDMFVVRDGKIMAQSFTGKITPSDENRFSFREAAQQPHQPDGRRTVIAVK